MSIKAFEIYSVKLQIMSKPNHTVFLNGITAPEFLLMRALHGPGAVEMLERQGEDIETRLNENGKRLKRIRPADSLTAYLINKYGEIKFKAVFPGENPILPFTYADAAIKNVNDDNAAADEFGDGWELDEAPAPAAQKAVPATVVKKDIDLIGNKKEA